MIVTLIKQVHSNAASCNSNDVWLERYIDLPSIPSVGLMLDFDDGNLEEIKEVCWNLVTFKVKVYVESDYTFTQLSLESRNILPDYHDTAQFKALIQSYKDAGWIIK